MQLLDETPAILLLRKLCSKRGYLYEWENGETLRLTKKWEDYYLYNGQLSTSRCIKTVIICQQHLCLQHRDPRISLIIPENWGTLSDPVTTRSDKHACGKPDADRSWQAGHGEWWTSKRAWTRKIQRKAFLIGYSPSQLLSRTWRRMCSHIPLKEGTQIRKVMLQKWRHTKRKHTVFMLTSAKPKEVHSASRKVWWLYNSRAQCPQRRTWISEQSPICCRGTSSRHSVESVSNQNFTGNGEEFTKVPKAVEESKSYSYVLSEFVKYCEDLSWNHRTTTLHRSETSGIAERAVRRIEEETSAVL